MLDILEQSTRVWDSLAKLKMLHIDFIGWRINVQLAILFETKLFDQIFSIRSHSMLE